MNIKQVEQIGKSLTELTKRAPFSLFRTLVRLVMEFDNQVETVVKLLKYCSDMEKDIFIFCFFQELTEQVDLRKDRTEEGSTAPWLQNLA